MVHMQRKALQTRLHTCQPVRPAGSHQVFHAAAMSCQLHPVDREALLVQPFGEQAHLGRRAGQAMNQQHARAGIAALARHDELMRRHAQLQQIRLLQQPQSIGSIHAVCSMPSRTCSSSWVACAKCSKRAWAIPWLSQ